MAHFPGKYLKTFVVSVDLALDERQRREVNQALNKYYTGKEQIPMNEKIPESLRNASYSVCATVRTTVAVGVTFDGQLELIHS